MLRSTYRISASRQASSLRRENVQDFRGDSRGVIPISFLFVDTLGKKICAHGTDISGTMDRDIVRTMGCCVLVAALAFNLSYSLPRRRPDVHTAPAEEVWTPFEPTRRCVGASVKGSENAFMSPPGQVKVRTSADCAVMCDAFRDCVTWATVVRNENEGPVCRLYPADARLLVETSSKGTDEVGGQACSESELDQSAFEPSALRRSPVVDETGKTQNRRASMLPCPGAKPVCDWLDAERISNMCATPEGRRLVQSCCVQCDSQRK